MSSHRRIFASAVMFLAVAIFLFGCSDREEPEVITSQPEVPEPESRVAAGPEAASSAAEARQNAVLRTEPQSQLPPMEDNAEVLRNDFRRMQDQWIQFSRETAAYADDAFSRMDQSIEARFQALRGNLNATGAEVTDDIRNQYDQLKEEIERATEHYWNETKDLEIEQKQRYEYRTRAFLNMIESHLNEIPERADEAVAEARKHLSAAKVGLESMEKAEGEAWRDLKNIQDETVDKLVESCRELKMNT